MCAQIATASLQATLDAARIYVQRGWSVVPIPRGAKAPVLRGWPELRLTEPDLSKHFSYGENLGFLLGAASGGLTDIDNDAPEAVALADAFLPPTNMIYGRASRLRAHRYYISTPTLEPAQFKDTDGTMIVELRSTGQQTLAPPSLHPRGERIEWAVNGDPAQVEGPELRAAVARLAACALLARHWPKRGGRHGVALPLSGFLLRAGWSLEETERFVIAAARIAGDEEAVLRAGDVHSTAKALAAGRPATGGPSLGEQVGREVVHKLGEWLRFGEVPRSDRTYIREVSDGGKPWPTLAAEALYGLAGDIVKMLDPYTEADPVASLAHFLAGFGNVIGPGPHCRVQHDEHPARFNFGLVGATSKGRKGLSWSGPRYIFAQIDAAWAKTRIKSGLSSGEGLIYHVRDPREERQPVKEKGRVIDYQSVQVDPGESDKRLLIIEPELAVILKRMTGEGNTLSAVMREAWDSGNLSTLTKNSPLQASHAYVSLVAHITREELTRYLTETERASGFANRFVWLLVRRSKTLPEGEAPPEAVLMPLIERIREAIRFAQTVREVRRDDQARAVWAAVYGDLSSEKPGLIGAIISRAEAQVLRLSLAYALLDLSPVIRPPHLLAALALWDYAEQSARLIFGDATGNPIADRILNALRISGELSETAISDLFHRNISAKVIDPALDMLVIGGLARCESKQTDGRPSTVWHVTN